MTVKPIVEDTADGKIGIAPSASKPGASNIFAKGGTVDQEETIDITLADADEERWQNQFAASQDMLIQMAQEAEADYNRGETWSIDKGGKDVEP